MGHPSLPTDPVSVEAMTEELSRRPVNDPLPTDPVSVEAMIEQLCRRAETTFAPHRPRVGGSHD